MYVVRRVAVSNMHQCKGILAEDVVGKDGALLLPKGSVLPWSGNAAAISKKLLRQGVDTLLVREELSISVEELEHLLRQSEIPIAQVDPELAKKTVHQIGEVFERMYETGGAEEDLTALTDTGRLLARELSRTPQILFPSRRYEKPTSTPTCTPSTWPFSRAFSPQALSRPDGPGGSGHNGRASS